MDSQYKTVEILRKGRETEDAGNARVLRAFGSHESPSFDPFLQFDELRSGKRAAFSRGFPWHPHRGIVTLSYVFNGRIEYEDQNGSKTVISAGDVILMHTGRGMIHKETPEATQEHWAVHLWLNVPGTMKMEPPTTNIFKEDDIPVYRGNDGLIVKVLSGEFRGISGPMREYCLRSFLDIHVPPLSTFTHYIPGDETAFAYILEGNADSPNLPGGRYSRGDVFLYGEGDTVAFGSEEEELRIILCSGIPIGEPVAWHGPIVMNTRDELDEAYKQYEEGTFLD